MAKPRTFKRTSYSRSDYGSSARKAYRASRYGRAYGTSYSSIMRGRRRTLLGGVLGIENKFLDTYGTLVSVPAPTDCSGGEIQPEGGCTNCLSAPAQGDDGSNRDGRKIKATSIFVTGELYGSTLQDQADSLSGPTVFVALVMDTQTNGSTIVSEQVFTNPSSGGANATALTNSFPLRNLAYSSRYKVLDHKTITMPTVVGTDGSNTMSIAPQQKSFQLSWKGEMPVTFGSGTSADVLNVVDNSLHLIAFNNMTQWTVVASFNARMRFVG